MSGLHTGRCFCGAVEIEVTGAPEEMGYCHCKSCRSYTGAPVSAYTLWRDANVTVTKGAELLRGFNRSGFSDRQHCTRCGGHIMTAHPGLGFTDIFAAVIPGIPFSPTVHLNYGETVLPIRDGLPKLNDFPAAAGGSGESVPE